MDLPAQPTPEQMYESEQMAENLRSVLPPYTLGILSLLDAKGIPHDFAVFAGHLAISPGAEPNPDNNPPVPPPVAGSVQMKVVPSQGLNVHNDAAFTSAVVKPALIGAATVQVIPGTERPQTVNGVTYVWIQLAARPGWVAKSEGATMYLVAV